MKPILGSKISDHPDSSRALKGRSVMTVIAGGSWEEPGGGGGGGGGEVTVVAAAAIFESPPKTAFTFSVPRNGTSWKSYLVEGDRPSTVHVMLLPIAVPATGVVHVPLVTDGAEPHEIGETA